MSAAVCGSVVLQPLLLFPAADVRGFALPEGSVEGIGVGGGSSLIEPSAVVVQVSSVAAAFLLFRCSVVAAFLLFRCMPWS